MDPKPKSDNVPTTEILESKEVQEDPQTVKESDVLHLNVGGSTNIAVLRRTLTTFEESMLGSRFSGRWDDSLEKDKYGNFFIDEDPRLFLQLLHFLRQNDKKKRNDLIMSPPPPTFDFCWMLEYYDLMTLVYPQVWLRVWGGEKTVFTRPSHGDDSFTIQTNGTMGAFKLHLDPDCKTKPAFASEFVAVFQQGSIGQIGWEDYCCSSGDKVGHGKNSLALDLESSCFMTRGQTATKIGNLLTRESSVTISCTYNKSENLYCVKIEDAPSACGTRCFLRSMQRLIPHISFNGTVNISHLSYAY